MFLTSKDVLYKQPGEKVWLAMDFDTWLNTDDVLLYSTYSIEPNDSNLILTDFTVVGHKIAMLADGGEPGCNYRVQITVIKNQGLVDQETLVGDGILKVRDR